MPCSFFRLNRFSGRRSCTPGACAGLLCAALTVGLARPCAGDGGSHRILSNRSFDTVATGLVSACSCDVANPSDPLEVQRAIGARMQRMLRAPERRHWLRTEAYLRRYRRLKPNQRLRFDRIFALSHQGRLLIPWPDRIKRQAVNTLQFTFVGFSVIEELELRQFLDRALPVMVNIFGPPFASGTVTIRADPNLQSLDGGIYIVSTNEIRIPLLTNNVTADTFNLVHMILHAFHGAAVFSFDAWEEGFAHAGAQLVMRQVEPTFDPLDDPFYVIQQYDSINFPALGNPSFFPEGGFGGMTPWRLGTAEAVWLKVAAENPGFFAQFNAQYYAQFDPGAAVPLAGNVPALKQIAMGIVPMVEGQSFLSWYRSQYVLDTSPTFGNKLYVFSLPLDQGILMLIYHYTTSSTGDESPLTTRASLTYRNDESDDLFAEEGNEADISDGEGAIAPQFFNLGGPNRIFIDLNASNVRLTVLFPWNVAGILGDPNKFFGVVLNSETGMIRVTPTGGATVEAEVRRGVFTFTSGITFAGPTPVTIEYTPEDGGSIVSYRRNVMVGFYEAFIAARPQLATITRTFTRGANGLHLMALPLTPLAPDEADVLGIARNRLLLARWRPDLPGDLKYELYPNITSPFEPGRAFWLKVERDTQVNVQGVPPPTDRPTRVRLIPGFNMVGNPYNASVDLSTLQVEAPGGLPVDLMTAVSQGLIAPGVFRFDPGVGYVMETSNLESFRGYWFRATNLTGVNLIFNPPTAAASRILSQRTADASLIARQARNPLQPAGGKNTRENWVLPLRLDSAQGGDIHNCIGVCPGASDGFDSRLDVVKPPPLESYVRLEMIPSLGAPAGVRLATDFRAPFAGQKVWEFSATTDLAEAEFTLSWPGIHLLPRDLRFHLTDLDTQKTISLRTSAAYRFRLAGVSRVRRFRLSVDTSPCALLRVDQLRAQAQGNNTMISFQLTRPAVMTLDVLGPNGRVIRRLLNNTGMSHGMNVLPWDGRDSYGRHVPRGVYLLQVRAEDDEGNVCQSTTQVQYR